MSLAFPDNNEAEIITLPHPSQHELEIGLLADAAHTSPKYLYDAVGSVLFDAICELPEYYPTRTEASIFTQYMSDIAHAIGPHSTLIDLGAGNCRKAARLFPLLHPNQYVPIDISIKYLEDAVQRLQQRFPYIEMTALGLDFSKPWTLPDEIRSDKRLFFYPGSSIGNFEPSQAHTFLRHLRSECDADGGLLIGIDLIKDHDTLHHAYDDALGVTAAFNLNVLRHINQILGTNFDVHQWRHHALFNTSHSRIEMHLEARTAQTVTWKNMHRHFLPGEKIHTENSYKYNLDKFLALLDSAGFGHAQCWTDSNNWFAVVYAKAL
ncbi:L-histidine N(alpha)-methyltransferase [Undibacterium sp. SXout20W]|uniref:L-histidine N(alpha)-methyltransferase n=1 Tax=Undibacterium sp. SXout20W TaxID=3413051 RepID=UPI003BEFA407